MDIKFANNASSRLLDNIDDESTSFSILPDSGALFPTLEAADDYFMITVVNPGDATYEIMKCTGIRGDLLTVERAQEGTIARAFPQNSIVDNRLTAKSIEKILNDADATGTNPGRVTIASPDDIQDGINNLAAITAANAWVCMVPPGSIIPYYGAFDDDGYVYDSKSRQVRTDWHRCDGTYGTPDLRDKFILSEGNEYTRGSTGGDVEYEITGSVGEHKLTIDEMPKHIHNVNGTHDFWYGTQHSFTVSAGTWNSASGKNSTDYMGGDKAHTHPITISAPSKIIPPYYVLSYIMKIK